MKFNLDNYSEYRDLLTSRFHERYKINEETNCWEWTHGKTKSGYGRFSLNGQMIRAHRFSYHIYNEIDPGRFECCHHCDNKICVNPQHLFLGTAKDNALDRENKKRHPHPSGENSKSSKLTNEQVLEIKKMLLNGVTLPEIEKLFSVTNSTVSAIKMGDRWSHVGTEMNDEIRKIKKRVIVGEQNYNTRLTKEKVLEIREKIANGQSCNSIAKEYGVTSRAIDMIHHRISWRHI
jgi:predicted DNA-binding protein YlxM (UPF0122 family)